jgi:hypothetical protein
VEKKEPEKPQPQKAAEPRKPGLLGSLFGKK